MWDSEISSACTIMCNLLAHAGVSSCLRFSSTNREKSEGENLHGSFSFWS